MTLRLLAEISQVMSRVYAIFTKRGYCTATSPVAPPSINIPRDIEVEGNCAMSVQFHGISELLGCQQSDIRLAMAANAPDENNVILCCPLGLTTSMQVHELYHLWDDHILQDAQRGLIKPISDEEKPTRVAAIESLEALHKMEAAAQGSAAARSAFLLKKLTLSCSQTGMPTCPLACLCMYLGDSLDFVLPCIEGIIALNFVHFLA